MKIRQEFAARLKTLREERHLTQEELARLCGWTDPQAQARISRYESASNSRVPALSDLVTLAKVLATTPGQLTFGDIDLSPEESRMLYVLRNCTNEVHKGLLKSAIEVAIAGIKNRTNKTRKETKK